MSLIKLAKKERQTGKGAVIGAVSGGALGLGAGLGLANVFHSLADMPILGPSKPIPFNKVLPSYIKLGLVGAGLGAAAGGGIGAGVGSLIKKDNE